MFELKAASRAAVVEEASACLASRLMVGPYERDDLNVFQKIIKSDSSLKNDQVRVHHREQGACSGEARFVK